MQAGSQHVLIEVSPSRLELAVFRGRQVVRSAARRLGPQETNTAFPASLEALAPVLTELVAEMQCASAKAIVVHSSPSTPVLVSSAPISLSAADAEEAARLALAGVADFSLDDSAFQMCELLTDAPAARGTSEVRQSHVISAAEATATILDIGAWVEAAGLRFEGAVPAAAVAMGGAAHKAWAVGRRAGDRAAVLWVGEHGSALACVTEGIVRFVRPVGVGIEALVDAMCQPLRARDDSVAARTLDRQEARRLIGSIGIPSAEQELPGMPGFTGAALLPVMQPALQRLTIETKQSLRFGLPEEERASVRMLIAGPGASVPGLCEWIARQCNLALGESHSGERGSLESGAETGAIAGVLAARTALPMLVPESIVRSTRRTQVRTAIAVGVVVAFGWLGAEWYSARARLLHESTRLTMLEHAASTGEATAKLQAATLAAKLALEASEARAAKTLGSGADAAATLKAIGLVAPEALRIGTIELTQDQDRIVCRISGHVRISESDNPTGTITQFVDTLGSIPIVRSARLGATQRTRIDGAQSQAFDLTVELVPIPVVGRLRAAEDPVASAEDRP